ncbi:SCO family protein [Haloferula sp. BvORR071]|uniref:SCO family protein n=1 Tax=Haloferula sp. BvORR071 TaxID=1396141 RepID=UPI0005513AD6|nr:SCO family protein [Haloferula sp. BvORR071]
MKLIPFIILALLSLPLRAEEAPDYTAPEPGSYTLPGIRPAPGGAVIDATGTARQLKDLTRGRVTVLSLIYSRCADPQACPHATGVLRSLHEQSTADPTLAGGLRLLSMSFDPEHDTPERMSAYSAIAGEFPQGCEWQFLTTASRSTLAPILADYGQAVSRKKDPASPMGPLNHSLRVFLIDESGTIRNIYSSGTLDPRLVMADIRTLLMEKRD